MESVGSRDSFLLLISGGLVQFGFGAVLEALHIVQHGRVAPQRSGGEECVAGGQHEVATRRDLDKTARVADGCSGGLKMLVFAREKLQAEQLVVAGNKALDLVKD